MKVASVWTRAIWSDGMHNAFPGIARFGDHYYVTCRHSEGHQARTATILVIRSNADDLEHWEKVAEFDLGGDSRDPFVCAVGDQVAQAFLPASDARQDSPDGPAQPRLAHLHVYWHHKEDYVSRSRDGVTWTDPQMLDTEFPDPPADCDIQFRSQRKWLFTMRRGPDGAYYSIGRCGLASRGEPGVLLYRSEDGLTWKAMHTFGQGIRAAIPPGRGGGHEADIAFLDNGVAVAAIRTNHQGLITATTAPYVEGWAHNAYWTGIYNFGCPALHKTPHGLLLAARSTPANEPARCTIWTVTPGGLISPFIVPSGGDCAYQTFADGPDGEILLCYYSSHEWPQRPRGANPANIYLARVTVAPGLSPAF